MKNEFRNFAVLIAGFFALGGLLFAAPGFVKDPNPTSRAACLGNCTVDFNTCLASAGSSKKLQDRCQEHSVNCSNICTYMFPN
jgi:hypothetical protein